MKLEMDHSLYRAVCTKAVTEITFTSQIDCVMPTHIYKKPDFSAADSMGKRMLLEVLQPVVCSN